MLSLSLFLLALVALFSSFSLCNADPTDWINTNYILSLRNQCPQTQRGACQAAIRNAAINSRGAPWSVTASTILAPSGDPRDYFSWAPYYWPDCAQCDASNAAADYDDDQPAANDPPSKRSRIDTAGSTTSSRHAGMVSSPVSSLPSLGAIEPDFPTIPLAANVTDVALAAKATATKSRSVPSKCVKVAPNAPASATWTSCAYTRHDGRVNPDVRQLNDSTWVNDASQAAVSDAVAFALTGDQSYASAAALIIDTFFADPDKGMNPNINYGQVVRGPGQQQGSFMAILDLRGLVKVVNAVEILRTGGARDWTWDRDTRLVNWATSYISWLQASPLGQQAANAANNHGSFFFAQLSALQVLVGDLDGARTTLRNFFRGPYQNQIVASGEQPFEAVRTRPAHYRAFNLEALLVMAKLADQLGLDAWRARSKYDATIQTALDYALASSARAPDASTSPPELAPHVATVMAAYGDPKHVYLSWLQNNFPAYTTRDWWTWNQAGAFAMSPSARPPTTTVHARRGYTHRVLRSAGSRKLKGRALSRTPRVTMINPIV